MFKALGHKPKSKSTKSEVIMTEELSGLALFIRPDFTLSS